MALLLYFKLLLLSAIGTRELRTWALSLGSVVSFFVNTAYRYLILVHGAMTMGSLSSIMPVTLSLKRSPPLSAHGFEISNLPIRMARLPFSSW